MNQMLALAGVIAVIIGVVLIIVSALSGEGRIQWAFGGIIGPVPFGFGSSPYLVMAAIAISILVFLLWLFFGSKLI